MQLTAIMTLKQLWIIHDRLDGTVSLCLQPLLLSWCWRSLRLGCEPVSVTVVQRPDRQFLLQRSVHPPPPQFQVLHLNRSEQIWCSSLSPCFKSDYDVHFCKASFSAAGVAAPLFWLMRRQTCTVVWTSSVISPMSFHIGVTHAWLGLLIGTLLSISRAVVYSRHRFCVWNWFAVKSGMVMRLKILPLCRGRLFLRVILWTVGWKTNK